MPDDHPICKGHDFQTSPNSIDAIMKSMLSTGFQATNVGEAIKEVERMRKWRLSDVPWKEGDDEALKDPKLRANIRARIFFAYTSNQISCGQREVIKRIGNLLVPNKNYCKFEDWMAPLITKMHDEQDAKWMEQARKFAARKDYDKDAEPLKPFAFTPSEVIARLGKEINNEESVLYWAYKNNIPVFCPALTDGSVGDMIFFHSYKRPGFMLDIARDIRGINDLSVQSYATGQIILGGGLVKHHTCNANLMRNGADYSVYINTGHEFDGSDSGASPDEAISWGKIRITAKPVKISADATIVWPLIVSQTFAKNVEEWKENNKDSICWIEHNESS